MPEEEANELWSELLDCIQELKQDCKDNRRARRHIRSLELTVNEIGMMLQKMAGKKGFLR
jgi:hypothetical protein